MKLNGPSPQIPTTIAKEHAIALFVIESHTLVAYLCMDPKRVLWVRNELAHIKNNIYDSYKNPRKWQRWSNHVEGLDFDGHKFLKNNTKIINGSLTILLDWA